MYGGRGRVDRYRVEYAVDMIVKLQDKNEYDRGLGELYYLLDGFTGHCIYHILAAHEGSTQDADCNAFCAAHVGISPLR